LTHTVSVCSSTATEATQTIQLRVENQHGAPCLQQGIPEFGSNNKQLWLASMRLFGCLTAKALTCCTEDAEGKYTDERIKKITQPKNSRKVIN